MDRGLKERLVGAAVLVAIGAWLIPWVLDGPEQISEPATTALDLPAPAAENPPIRTETVVLERRESPVAAQTADPAPDDATVTSQEGADDARGSMTAASPAPASRPEPAAAEPASPSGTQWFVQLGAFGDRDNAERQAARVSTFGFQAHVSAFPAGGGAMHRVRVGPQTTRERAESIASSLSVHGFVAQVVFE